jgi:hypothetical protein
MKVSSYTVANLCGCFLFLSILSSCASLQEGFCRDPINAKLFPDKCPRVPHSVLVTSNGQTVLVEDPALSNQLDRMNVAARSRQNERFFTRHLQQFERVSGSGCEDVMFKSLQEPGNRRFSGGIDYIMHAESKNCGNRTYEVTITFQDPHNTVAKSVIVNEVR